MERLKNWLAFPGRTAGLLVRAAGRITVGAVGILLMAAGLALLDVLGRPYLGIPLFTVGLILLVKAVF